MLDKLITADQLKMLSDEEKYANSSRYVYNGGGANSAVKYYKVLSRSLEGTIWEHDRIVFSFTTRHSGSGLIILAFSFNTSLDIEATASNFDFRIIQSKQNYYYGLKAYYNKNTHVISLLMTANDYSNLKLRIIGRESGVDKFTYHDPVPLDNIPNDIGDEIPTHECLFDDSLAFASESDVSNLFGGGLINRVLRKLKGVLNYAR